MIRTINYSWVFCMGTTQTMDNVKEKAQFTFKPATIYSNAPKDGGAFYLKYTMPDGELQIHDLSIASNHKLPIDWPLVERGQFLEFTVEHRCYVPKGYICGQSFQLCITIAGGSET